MKEIILLSDKNFNGKFKCTFKNTITNKTEYLYYDLERWISPVNSGLFTKEFFRAVMPIPMILKYNYKYKETRENTEQVFNLLQELNWYGFEQEKEFQKNKPDIQEMRKQEINKIRGLVPGNDIFQ